MQFIFLSINFLIVYIKNNWYWFPIRRKTNSNLNKNFLFIVSRLSDERYNSIPYSNFGAIGYTMLLNRVPTKWKLHWIWYSISFKNGVVSKVRMSTCGGRKQAPVSTLGQIKFVPNSAVSVPRSSRDAFECQFSGIWPRSAFL